MDLDKRLREILRHTTQAESIPLQIAQIKLAFSETGYVDIHKGFEPFYYEVKKGDQVINKIPLMTGDYWYERFEEILKEVDEGRSPYTVDAQRLWDGAIKPAILEAAKKASGLDREDV